MRRWLALAVIGCLTTPAVALDSGADGLRYAGMDSALGVAANIVQLNGVKEFTTPKFDRAVAGVDAKGRDILIGATNDVIGMFSVGWKGAVGSNDLRDITALEDEFGLAGLEKTVRAECDDAIVDNGLSCVEITYGCASAEAEWCPITLLSFWPPETGKAKGSVRVIWTREPQ